MPITKFDHDKPRTHKVCGEDQLLKLTTEGWQLEAVLSESKILSCGSYIPGSSKTGERRFAQQDIPYQVTKYLLFKGHSLLVLEANKERDKAIRDARATEEEAQPERERSWALARRLVSEKEETKHANKDRLYWNEKHNSSEEARRKLEGDLTKMRKFFGEGQIKEALADF